MKKIIFLTNKQNNAYEEDKYLIDFIGKDCDLIVAHPLDCEPLLPTATGVIIRNIWPTHEYSGEWEKISQQIVDSGLPTYNSLFGKGDNKGKDYLLELFKDGYPVIPSVESLKEMILFGDLEYFWIKPKDGCDGSDSGKYTKDELEKKDLTNYIIQPYTEFVSEPSFFFIDNVFSHAITMPNRLADRDISTYDATHEDLLFAQQFVDWNKLPHGIQRIDAVRTKDGKLLLTEVEDLCPYLYINDIDEKIRQRFLSEIRTSVMKIFNFVKPMSTQSI